MAVSSFWTSRTQGSISWTMAQAFRIPGSPERGSGGTAPCPLRWSWLMGEASVHGASLSNPPKARFVFTDPLPTFSPLVTTIAVGRYPGERTLRR